MYIFCIKKRIEPLIKAIKENNIKYIGKKAILKRAITHNIIAEHPPIPVRNKPNFSNVFFIVL